MNEITTRAPEVIAAEINAIKRTTAKYVLEQSIEIGRLLCEAKEAVPYGEWGRWLDENCAYSTSNANNLMRIYTEYGEDESQLSFFSENKLELYGNLNRSQAVALLALPAVERAEFVKENDVAAMSVSELEAKIKEAKEAARAEALAESAGQIADLNDRIDQAKADADRLKVDNAKLKIGADELIKVKRELKEAKADAESIRASSDKQTAKLLEENEALKKQLAIPVVAEITDEQRAEIAAEVRSEVREEADAEIRALQNQNSKLQMAADPTIQQFTVYFEQMQNCYNKMQELLEKCADSQTSAKLSTALLGLIDSMEKRINTNE